MEQNIKHALEQAILRGLEKQVIPGSLDTVDNIYDSIEPVIETYVTEVVQQVLAQLDMIFSQLPEKK